MTTMMVIFSNRCKTITWDENLTDIIALLMDLNFTYITFEEIYLSTLLLKQIGMSILVQTWIEITINNYFSSMCIHQALLIIGVWTTINLQLVEFLG